MQHRRLAHAHGIGDVLQRGALEAVRSEQTHGGGHGRPPDVVLVSADRYHLDGYGLPDGKEPCKPSSVEHSIASVFVE